MNIAVIAWGSLIWCPGSLSIRTRWRPDGPPLPLEFARISRDGRVTLVILPGSEDQGTYWAMSEFTALDEARRNLSEREGAKLADIHFLVRDEGRANAASPEVAERVGAWLLARHDLGAAVWTGLRNNWNEKRGQDFTPGDAVQYLEDLEERSGDSGATYDRAREYITNAPPLIDTNVRKAMRARGWQDTELPTILFER